MRLGGVMIFVKDLAAMTAFYSQVLGLSPIAATRLDNWVEFDAGPARFSLHAIPAEIAKDIEIARPPAPREANPIKPSFEVEDLAGVRERAGALGGVIIDRPWGGCDLVDPEGNVIGLQAS